MVYHPYIRGKQFELVAIRELASLIEEAGFCPIIEPVKEQVKVLQKTLDAMCDVGASAVLIVNPQIGEHSANQQKISQLLDGPYAGSHNVIPGLVLTKDMSTASVAGFCNYFSARPVCLIHDGFPEAKILAGTPGLGNINKNLFVEAHAGKLYQKHFAAAPGRILVRDGFKYQAANRDYPDVEFFSDLHVTYADEGMSGFGDFLIVGNRFVEGGGPAYAIAIHITYIDDQEDDAMFIRHFKSDSQSTPTNPAGKFAEAVKKLIEAVDAPGSKILETTAIAEFRDFHNTGHYPGLGYVKKLSMIHHIETLKEFLS